MAAPSSSSRDPFSGLELLSEEANLSLGSMEAVDWTPPAAAAPSRLPGLVLAAGVTATSIAVHAWLLRPLEIPLGPSAIAIVVGIAVANLVRLPSAAGHGLHWIVAALIPVAIVALGGGLDLAVLARQGWAWLGLVLLSVALALLVTTWVGRCLGLQPPTTFLVAAGTAICGSSAILAVAPLLNAKKEAIITSVAAVNVIGMLAMGTCIAAGLLFPIGATDFGLWAGSTIHAVPTVAGAAFDHSSRAGEVATLIKLGRVAMLAPLVVGVALWCRRSRTGGAKRPGWKRSLSLIPWFVVGFVITALLNTLQLLPVLEFSSDSILIPRSFTVDAGLALQGTGKLLLTLAMAAIGLQVGLRSMIDTGRSAFLTALVAWAIVSALVLGTILIL